MFIKYRNSDKTPSDGDLKTLKSGKKFIRQQRRVDGMYVVCNGRPCYEWYPYDSDTVERLRKQIEKDISTFFRSDSTTQVNTGRSIHISFR